MEPVTKPCRCPVCDAAFYALITIEEMLVDQKAVTRDELQNTCVMLNDALSHGFQHGDSLGAS